MTGNLGFTIVLVSSLILTACGDGGGGGGGDGDSSLKCPDIEGVYDCTTTLTEKTCSWITDPIGTNYYSVLDIMQDGWNLVVSEDDVVEYDGSIDSDVNFSWSEKIYLTVSLKENAFLFQVDPEGGELTITPLTGDTCVYEINSLWEGNVSGETLSGTITNTCTPHSGDCTAFKECNILESFIAEPY
jgi:hypothetical protein